MADKQSTEKQALLRAYGAEVVLCPTNVAPESPESYYSVAARLARDIPGAFKPDQYWNMENPQAHEATTGPEIWDQTEGRITHFVASVGTGGTISRRGRYLHAPKPDIVGDRRRPGGQRALGRHRAAVPDRGRRRGLLPGHVRPGRRRSLGPGHRTATRSSMARRLTREEGILSGESCGTALVAAREVVRELTADASGGSEAVVVVILPDGGRNYLSKLYNDEWMRVNGLLPTTGRGRPGPSSCSADRHHDGDRPAARPGPDDAARRRGDRDAPGVRHQPDAGVGGARGRWRRGIVGSITERGLLDRAFRDPSVVERTVGEVMDRPLPFVEAWTRRSTRRSPCWRARRPR